MAFVSSRKTVNQIVLVFPDAPVELVGHPDVQSARSARDHVHEIVVLFHTSTTVTATISSTLSSPPSRLIGFADHWARGGTCCSLLPGIPGSANCRSLDCEDRPPSGRSSSLG